MTRIRTHQDVGPVLSSECRARLEQVFAWLDGELSRSEARAIAAHIETCECCGGLAEDLQRAIAACRAVGDCRVPKDVHHRARARARALLRGKSPGPSRR